MIHSPHLFYAQTLTVSMGDEKHNIQKMALGSIANFIREINNHFGCHVEEEIIKMPLFIR